MAKASNLLLLLLAATAGCTSSSWRPRTIPLEPPAPARRIEPPKLGVESPLIQDFGAPPRLTVATTNASADQPQDSPSSDTAAKATEAPLIAQGQSNTSRPAPKPPLELTEVLESVRNRYPPMLAALLEEDIANGRLLSAQGGFDFNIVAKSTLDALGFYRFSDTSIGLEQPTALGGLALLGGYKVSTGTLPVYDGDKKTNEAGELSAGFRLPLLQGMAIDRRRAALSQAQIDQALADPVILRQRLDFLRVAARAYWNWVAAGKRLEIAEDLLRIALERDAAIARRVERGDLPGIDRLDNERLVVQRRTFVIAAERRFEQAAIELSLYYRDLNDEPVVAKRDRLPTTFPGYPSPEPQTFDTDVRSAFDLRPEVRRLQLLADRAGIDLDLAENQTLPGLDLTVLGTAPLDDAPYKDKKDFDVKATLEFKMPVQRRDAFGRADVARTQIQRIQFEAQFARDRIRAEIGDALSARVAAFRQITEFQRNLELARRLEQAERRSFDLGRSNLIFVNLREQATADAAALEVDAIAEYLRTLADYAVACGLQHSVGF